MAKHNPDTVTTVALSHAEIYELLEACKCVDWENQDYMNARSKLQRAVTPPKEVHKSHAPVH